MSFFYSICLVFIKKHLPLRHDSMKQKDIDKEILVMNLHTSINLAVLHIIRFVVVSSRV